jgi:hypothetical protein
LENIIDFTSFDELENWRSGLNNFIIEGRDNGEDWGNVMLSDIVCGKLISEWFNHKRSRKRQSMNSFILEYFVTKFPTRELSLSMLKDFVVTLKSHF